MPASPWRIDGPLSPGSLAITPFVLGVNFFFNEALAVTIRECVQVSILPSNRLREHASSTIIFAPLTRDIFACVSAFNESSVLVAAFSRTWYSEPGLLFAYLAATTRSLALAPAFCLSMLARASSGELKRPRRLCRLGDSRECQCFKLADRRGGRESTGTHATLLERREVLAMGAAKAVYEVTARMVMEIKEKRRMIRKRTTAEKGRGLVEMNERG